MCSSCVGGWGRLGCSCRERQLRSELMLLVSFLKTYNSGLCATKPTDNTNSKNLELYSRMDEDGNAGFPLLYCLLSTGTVLFIEK